MYILKSLFYSIASLKLSDYELICYALKSVPYKRIHCSTCGKTGHLKLHSRYSRDCTHTVHGCMEDVINILNAPEAPSNPISVAAYALMINDSCSSVSLAIPLA